MWGATNDVVYCDTDSVNFNSHTPCGVRRYWGRTVEPKDVISTHTPHVGCDANLFHIYVHRKISTHTPHVGCDAFADFIRILNRNFNSHTPCGVRPPYNSVLKFLYQFQLTHPMWGATSAFFPVLLLILFQLTHPMWGATPLRSVIAIV